MTKERAIKILIEFFKDEFSRDPGGVGEWIAADGDDIEELFAIIPTLEDKGP